MKKNKNLGPIIAIVAFVAVVICSIVITQKLSPSVDFNKIKVSEFADIIKEEEVHFIYIGRPTCGYCVQSEPWTKRISSEMEKEVYYINIDEETSEDLEILADLTDDIYRGATPLFLVTKNGEIVDYKEGAGNYESLREFFINAIE
ncbi:MAG TPA: thioredoxin family protein [Mollicutes bacterium]|nr:thioredoxin family protein [Mollicutes bacterium]